VQPVVIPESDNEGSANGGDDSSIEITEDGRSPNIPMRFKRGESNNSTVGSANKLKPVEGQPEQEESKKGDNGSMFNMKNSEEFKIDYRVPADVKNADQKEKSQSYQLPTQVIDFRKFVDMSPAPIVRKTQGKI